MTFTLEPAHLPQAETLSDAIARDGVARAALVGRRWALLESWLRDPRLHGVRFPPSPHGRDGDAGVAIVSWAAILINRAHLGKLPSVEVTITWLLDAGAGGLLVLLLEQAPDTTAFVADVLAGPLAGVAGAGHFFDLSY